MKIATTALAILAVSVMTASVSHAWSYSDVDSTSRYRSKGVYKTDNFQTKYRARGRKVQLENGNTIRQTQRQRVRRWR